jgi:ArsR family transcriptional regulator
MTTRAKTLSLERVFRALADRTRLRILHLLRQGELCVCDLVDLLGVPQPTASRHLAYLRRAGLVEARREGHWMYYRLAPPRSPSFEKLLACLAVCCQECLPLSGEVGRRKSNGQGGSWCP